MGKLADVDVLIEAIEKKRVFVFPNDDPAEVLQRQGKVILQAINDAPAVDAVPLIRARWFYPAPGDGDPVCTNCNCNLFYDMYYGEHRETPYCPNCGAKMDKED